MKEEPSGMPSRRLCLSSTEHLMVMCLYPDSGVAAVPFWTRLSFVEPVEARLRVGDIILDQLCGWDKGRQTSECKILVSCMIPGPSGYITPTLLELDHVAYIPPTLLGLPQPCMGTEILYKPYSSFQELRSAGTSIFHLPVPSSCTGISI